MHLFVTDESLNRAGYTCDVSLWPRCSDHERVKSHRPILHVKLKNIYHVELILW